MPLVPHGQNPDPKKTHKRYRCLSCGKCNNSGMVTCPFCQSQHTIPSIPPQVPQQNPLVTLPTPPKPCRWKIEYSWRDRAVALGMTSGWFFHSEYKIERAGVNAIAKLRREFGGGKKYRIRPSLWTHDGDIEVHLRLPGEPIVTSSPDPDPESI